LTQAFILSDYLEVGYFRIQDVKGIIA